MKLHTLNDLFVDQLHDLHSMENQIVKTLPKIAKRASCSELRGALEDHLEETKNELERLEGIFEKLGVSSRGKKCAGMGGILEEAKDFLSKESEPDAMDAGLIAIVQRVEHYEIAGYGCARTWAEQLGMSNLGAYQASQRGGDVRVRVAGDRVRLGGKAVTVVRGTLA